ncbi:MAG: hypothetical protein ACXVJL_15645, partial [Candidatus Angelobacter sp.]
AVSVDNFLEITAGALRFRLALQRITQTFCDFELPASGLFFLQYGARKGADRRQQKARQRASERFPRESSGSDVHYRYFQSTYRINPKPR